MPIPFDPDPISPATDDLLRFQDLELDLANFRVRAGKRSLPLSVFRVRVLEWFMRRPGVIFSREELNEGVWLDSQTSNLSIKNTILRLQRDLHRLESRSNIITIYAKGYALLSLVEWDRSSQAGANLLSGFIS